MISAPARKILTLLLLDKVSTAQAFESFDEIIRCRNLTKTRRKLTEVRTDTGGTLLKKMETVPHNFRSCFLCSPLFIWVLVAPHVGHMLAFKE